jgi:K+-sensing histidine kinase KdpD
MKNILLCTDGSAFAENVYKYGAWFANQFHAKINVLFVTDIRSQKVVSTSNFSGSLGLGASEELLHELVNLEHEKAKLNNKRARLILQNMERNPTESLIMLGFAVAQPNLHFW